MAKRGASPDRLLWQLVPFGPNHCAGRELYLYHPHRRQPTPRFTRDPPARWPRSRRHRWTAHEAVADSCPTAPGAPASPPREPRRLRSRSWTAGGPSCSGGRASCYRIPRRTTGSSGCRCAPSSRPWRASSPPPKDRFQVHRRELPLPNRIVAPGPEPSQLLLVGYREPVLAQDDVVVDEHLFEEGRLPQEQRMLLRRTESHHLLDTRPVVPGPVEQ